MNGVLFFGGNPENTSANFFAIILIDGYVQLRYDFFVHFITILVKDGQVILLVISRLEDVFLITHNMHQYKMKLQQRLRFSICKALKYILHSTICF